VQVELVCQVHRGFIERQPVVSSPEVKRVALGFNIAKILLRMQKELSSRIEASMKDPPTRTNKPPRRP
jgi:hypothetical protein